MCSVIQIYGRRKCRATRKATRFFAERRIDVQNVDIDDRAPGAREIELFLQVAGPDIVDTEGREYQEKGFAYMDFDPGEELARNPGLLRTPVVRLDRDIAVGDDEAGWKRIAESAKT